MPVDAVEVDRPEVPVRLRVRSVHLASPSVRTLSALKNTRNECACILKRMTAMRKQDHNNINYRPSEK